MATVFYYIGRTLQLSGLALGLMVIIFFFNPANGEARLLMMTVISAAIFLGGQFLVTSTGSEQ